MKLKKGLFITFEGGEGAGKSTLIEEIFRQLVQEGFSVLKTREPGGTSLGEQIRKILLLGETMTPQAELCLFLAARAEHIDQIIGPALEEGKIVLCDRFNDSSIVYQGAARGLGMEKVAGMCQFISQGLQPDLTLYLDVSPEKGLSRAKARHGHDRIEAETLEFHLRIREAYLQLFKTEKKRFYLINAEKSIPEVYQQTLAAIQQLVMHNHV
jgi:dTMP kinase